MPHGEAAEMASKTGLIVDSYLSTIYFDTALAAVVTKESLPGFQIESTLSQAPLSAAEKRLVQAALERSVRKLCLTWHASEEALAAEREVFMAMPDMPTLIGQEAIEVYYHLEAFVLLGRSALDTASRAFGLLLPSPFPRGRFDSFNKLVKKVCDTGPTQLRKYLLDEQDNTSSWLSLLCGIRRGRSLRDQIAHQLEFPLAYDLVQLNSDRYTPVVVSSDVDVPFTHFVTGLRSGLVAGFRRVEEACCERTET